MRPSLELHAPQTMMPQSRRQLIVLCYGLMLIIVAVDWLTTAGVVVGLLLSAPIVLLSLLDSRRYLVVATGFALLGFAVAAIYGQAPVSPPSVWVPNRVLAVFGIAASGAVAVLLQRHRMTAERALDAALSARDTNRLLMSLMAHDLRAPLVAASQALEYVERSAATGAPLDAELVGDTRLRLRRNLRVIELVLQVARSDIRQAESARQPDHPRVRIADEIERETASFAGEAEACGKQIVLTVEPVRDVEMGFDGLVLRQVLAILLDNAIRHARPGPVTVEAQLKRRQVVVSVTDTGPGLSARSRPDASAGGSGIGLELCRMLATRVGGSLDLEQDSERGTRFSLRLPFAAWDREGRVGVERRVLVEGARRVG
jgi:signal transduction histidine kinase